MKRAPMKRTGFKRSLKEPSVERADKPLAELTRPLTLHRGTYAGGLSGAVAPKREYVRSEPLMRAYRLIPCQHCGVQDGTVCGAHSNWAEHGKGKSIKADDNRCASLCFTCHGMLDQGSILGKAERYALWCIAHSRPCANCWRAGCGRRASRFLNWKGF
jgi:hypothetical protein